MIKLNQRLELIKGATITVCAQGGCELILLDSENYKKMRNNMTYVYIGGSFKYTPARLSVPASQEWYLVVNSALDPDRAEISIDITNQNVATNEGVRGRAEV